MNGYWQCPNKESHCYDLNDFIFAVASQQLYCPICGAKMKWVVQEEEKIGASSEMRKGR